MGEDFLLTVGEVHVGAVGDDDQIGGKRRRCKHRKDLFDIVLGVAINCSTVKISRLADGYDACMKVISRVAKAREGVDNQYGIWSPFGRLTKINIVVGPFVEHFDSSDPGLGLAGDNRADRTGFVVVPDGPDFDRVEARGAFLEDLELENVEEVIEVKNAQVVVGDKGDKGTGLTGLCVAHEEEFGEGIALVLG